MNNKPWNFDYFYSYIEKDFNKYHDIIADLQKRENKEHYNNILIN